MAKNHVLFRALDSAAELKQFDPVNRVAPYHCNKFTHPTANQSRNISSLFHFSDIFDAKQSPAASNAYCYDVATHVSAISKAE